MPITGNLAWDESLKRFKGRDLSHYLLAVAATATACATCRAPLLPDAALSLVVDIVQGTEPDGTPSLLFTSRLCHRRCREPAVNVSVRSGLPAQQSSLGVRFTLGRPEVPPGERTAVLVYTLTPSLHIGEPGGEMTSVHVAALLSQGFGLALNPDPEALRHSAPTVRPGTACHVERQGPLVFELNGHPLHTQPLNPGSPTHQAWLTAARANGILVIAGDHLDIGPSTLDLQPAARLRTLAAGRVPLAEEAPAG